jgi:hypothetical protein
MISLTVFIPRGCCPIGAAQLLQAVQAVQAFEVCVAGVVVFFASLFFLFFFSFLPFSITHKAVHAGYTGHGRSQDASCGVDPDRASRAAHWFVHRR